MKEKIRNEYEISGWEPSKYQFSCSLLGIYEDLEHYQRDALGRLTETCYEKVEGEFRDHV